MIKAIAAKAGKPVGEQVNMMVGRLAYLITRKTSGNLFFTVRYCLREIIRNIAEHSESDDFLVMGQFWPQSRDVELAVLDRGIGLQRSLANNPKFAALGSDRKAIRIALLPSTSGKKIYEKAHAMDTKDTDGEWGNSGFGLYITSQMARATGRFVIGSGNARLEFARNAKYNGDFFLPGTLVSMTVNVDKLGQLEAALKAISDRGEAFARRYLTAGADVIASAASRLLMENEQ
ncbi:hypothetical protein [Thermohalobaculum sediminis]|uniref:hypothetical protein n=1 Tax=Thermohalobaculum sediminis TaxID=2939436 RepID=UPI0020BEE9D3|nr:hypothetical protein [Limibaculum sediminis]